MKQITRPDFCTTVSPDEYDYVEQFDLAMKHANIDHKKNNEDCPPPYYPFDAGKIYGLVMEVQRLKEKLKNL